MVIESLSWFQIVILQLRGGFLVIFPQAATIGSCLVFCKERRVNSGVGTANAHHVAPRTRPYFRGEVTKAPRFRQPNAVLKDPANSYPHAHVLTGLGVVQQQARAPRVSLPQEFFAWLKDSLYESYCYNVYMI